MSPPGAHVWRCPSCGRQVPLRIEECRCGTSKAIVTSQEEAPTAGLASQATPPPQTEATGGGTRFLLVGLLLGLTLAAVGFVWLQPDERLMVVLPMFHVGGMNIQTTPALQLGATYIARAFSGDKTQLVPLIKGAIEHQGAAFIDVISPCVAFNNHAGSTKSFDYVREHNEAVNKLDFISARAPIHVDYDPGTTQMVEQHDGSRLVLKKVSADYDANDRLGAMNFLGHHASKGQIVTGLIFVDSDPEDLHRHFNTVDKPLNTLSEKELCPGSAALDKINAALR